MAMRNGFEVEGVCWKIIVAPLDYDGGRSGAQSTLHITSIRFYIILEIVMLVNYNDQHNKARIIMKQVNIHVAKAHLSELIKKAMLGEEIIIAKDNKPVVKLVALHPAKHKRRLGSAKGLFTMAKDFNEPLEDFDEYTK